jgi:hypothetical protein
VVKSVLEKIETEKSYINYDNDFFVLMMPYINNTTTDNKILDSLAASFGLNKSLFWSNDLEEAKEQPKKSYGNFQRNTPPKASLFGSSSPPPFQEEKDPTANGLFGVYWDVSKTLGIQKGFSDPDKKKIATLKRVIHCYFALLKKDLKSSIPKYIVKILIDNTILEMRKHLQTEIYKLEDKAMFIAEDQDIQNRRKISLNNLKLLEKALTSIRNLKRECGDI